MLRASHRSESRLPTPSTPEAASIFQQTWWVELATGAALEVAEVRWDGRVVASLPFVRERSLGFTLLHMPPYTRTLPPILSPAGVKAGQAPAQHA